MGSTPAPECQRDGLEQMEAAVNNLIHEKMGLTGPRMGFQITRATSWGLGFSGEVKKTRAGGGGICSSSHIATQRLWGRGFNPTEPAFIQYLQARGVNYP